MNRIVSRLLSLSLLLALTLGCNKDKGPSPDALTDDPTGLPMPSPDCRIVKETLKILLQEGDAWSEVETITLLDGRKVQVGKIHSSTYQYDERGCLSKVITTGQEAINTDTFQYSSSMLTFHTVNHRKDGTIQLDITTHRPLNSRGLIAGSYTQGSRTE